MLMYRFLKVLFLAVFLLFPFACNDTQLRESPRSTPSIDFEESIESSDDTNDTLYIYCLNVGHGDATLIISPSGQTMLIDAGKNGRGNSEVVPFLDSVNITSLDFLVATHYHADHIGGIDEVVGHLTIDLIETVYDRNWSYSTGTYDDYADSVNPKREIIADSQVIDLGAGVYLTCVAVNGNGILDSPFTDSRYSENDLSVALKLTYGEFDFFVGGDLSGRNTSSYKDIETSVAPKVGKVEVLQVNHHGSNNNSNQFFLDTLQPIVAIVSVGDNTHGLPHPDAITRLQAVPSVVYQTEDGDGNVIDGDITVKVHSDQFWVNGDPYSVHTGTFVPPSTDADNVTVYITDTGSKYHLSSCSYLTGNETPISLEEAKDQGYTACSRCDPPG